MRFKQTIYDSTLSTAGAVLLPHAGNAIKLRKILAP